MRIDNFKFEPKEMRENDYLLRIEPRINNAISHIERISKSKAPFTRKRHIIQSPYKCKGATLPEGSVALDHEDIPSPAAQ